MKKSIFLFALLFLSFSTSLWADDDIVWMIKREVHGNGILLNNEKYIWLSAVDHNIVRNAETGEFIKEFERKTFHNLRILPYNNGMNYIHINDANNKLYYYEAENFTIIDSLEKEGKGTFGPLSRGGDSNILYELDSSVIRVWDIISKKVVREIEISIPINERAGTKPETIAVHNNLSIQGVDCDNKRLLIAQETEYELDNTPPMSEYVNSLAFYNAQTLEKLYSFNDTKGTFRTSNICKYLAKLQGNIELYDYKTMELITTIKGVDNTSVRSLCFTNDDRYLIVTTMNSYIMQIWDLHNQKLIKTYDNTLPGVVLCITNDNQFAYCSIGNEFYKLRLNIDSGSIGVEDTPTEEDNVPYPNPTNDKVNFEFKIDRPDIYSLKVIDLNGKEVLSQSIGQLNIGLNKVELEKNNLSKGRYSVLIYSSSNSFKYNIIIGE